jgi:hypothetical protein
MTLETKTPKSVGSLAWGADHAPTYCEGINSLYSWASNYQDMKPFRKLLDLVGYSMQWANRPQDCEAWVSELLSVESEFGL